MLAGPSCFRIARFVLFSFASALSLHAQSTEADLKARLKHKPLYLRGCWNDDQLHFDSTGKLISQAGHITITLCGFDFKNLHLTNSKLILDGSRVGLELANDKIKRVDLLIGNPPQDQHMHLEIDAPSNGDYSAALDNIFASDLAEMVPSLPFYWQSYAQKHFLPLDPAPAPQASPVQTTVQPKKIGGSVLPPKPLHYAAPQFSPTARALKYGGNVLVNIWVMPDGTVTHLSVVRAAGIGLDEIALDAVQQYQFAPATQDGKPVTVELNIEVNFAIF